MRGEGGKGEGGRERGGKGRRGGRERGGRGGGKGGERRRRGRWKGKGRMKLLSCSWLQCTHPYTPKLQQTQCLPSYITSIKTAAPNKH